MNKIHLTGVVICLILLMAFFSVNAQKQGKEQRVERDIAPIDTSFLDFAFVSAYHYIVVAGVDTTWGAGKPHLEEGYEMGVRAVMTDVNQDSLPAGYKKLLHRHIWVYSDSGKKGIAEITSFTLLTQFIPHFGQVQRWNGTEGVDSPYTAEEIALDIRRSVPTLLVARFEFINKKEIAGNYLFAVAANRRAPRSYVNTPAVALENKILAAAYKTDTYKTIQKDFVQNLKKKSYWTKEGDVQTEFYHFKNKKGTDFVTLTQEGGNPCGGDFYGEVFSFWQIGKNGIPKLLYMDNMNASTLMAVDIDNDDFPELLIQTGTDYFLIQRVDGNWERIYSYGILNQDCPC